MKGTKLLYGLLIIAVIIILIVTGLMVDSIYPYTLIGIEGLKQLRRYLVFQFIHSAFSAFLLVFSAVLFIFGKEMVFPSRNSDSEVDRKIRIRLWIAIISLSSLIFFFTGNRNNFDIQSRKNDYSEIYPLKTISLITDIGRDISEAETYEVITSSCSVNVMDQSYSHNSAKRGRKTVKITEYKLTDVNGQIISQISYDDYRILKEKFRQYVPHAIELYKHSGLIASIDNETGNFKTDEMEYITLSYSNGKFSRTTHEYEDEFKNLTFMVELNGEIIAGINAESKTEFSFTLQEGMKAYIAMASYGKYECISNVIEY